eukprot:scaffold16557_cov91-Skeletonema_marinoi.AAC.1
MDLVDEESSLWRLFASVRSGQGRLDQQRRQIPTWCLYLIDTIYCGGGVLLAWQLTTTTTQQPKYSIDDRCQKGLSLALFATVFLYYSTVEMHVESDEFDFRFASMRTS